MDKRAIRTVEGAREIIEYNLNVLYHLPAKYVYLNRALVNVRADLLKLLKFCKDHNPIIWKQMYVWFVDTNRLTAAVRHRTTRSTSNRHFNFLSCIGAINKLEQYENNRTGVNMTFLLNERENGKIRDINTFTVYRYTDKKLEEMERRSEQLVTNKITSGNISRDKLVASGCVDLADEVFYANNKNSVNNKIREFQTVLDQLERLCAEKGYTNKVELCNALGWSRDKLDAILNIFNGIWGQQYQYKPPNKADIELYGLKSKSWIIKRRLENGKE